MRFLRLPSLIALIALASTLVPNVSFLLRFAALMLAALTILGALSDLQGATRRDAPTRDDLLKLWFGGKLREQHTWEALKADVAATASALRLPPPVSAPRPPNPRNNGNRRSDTLRLRAPSGTLKTSDQPTTAEATPPPADKRPKESLWPMLRLLANEALSECIVIATILLNWFKPAPGATAGEQLALLALGLLALGLLWFDWRLLRRFVAAVQQQLAGVAP